MAEGDGVGEPNSVPDQVAVATRALARSMGRLRFSDPITHVYNPLIYARACHEEYIRRFARSSKKVVFLGMNPGPFGMAQTGVPFGAVGPVRDWLGIQAPVRRPRREHPKRPIQGFDCNRNEVSGERLWGAIAARFGTPGRFFRHHYIANYCPLIFLEQSGRNRTPDKLPVTERDPLFRACDRHLRRIVDALSPDWVVGIGIFAEGRARVALADRPIRIGRILHPSPANPRAQRDWSGTVRRELRGQGVCSE